MPHPGRIAIIGGGPTGLGAAHRLHECNYDEVALFEAKTHPGGLAASFVDEQGFTWDIGGHVQFSHYTYFDDLMDELLPNEWLDHERESWVWVRQRFVPYPFQYNIRHLPPPDMRRCLRGLLQLTKQARGVQPQNFREWIFQQFGEGIAEIFMLPYNYKTWAYPPETMSCSWMGERVARIDLERLVFNILDERDDVSWGPNNTFRFPHHGGTGEIWRRLASRLPSGWLHYEHELTAIDVDKKRLTFANGMHHEYDTLISTMPLDNLVGMSNLPSSFQATAGRLRHSKVHVFGIGLAGQPPAHLQKKCWMYFPEDSSPFFRATVFSNYSPQNVPDISRHWSLMVEISESPQKPVEQDRLEDTMIKGLLATKLVADRDAIVDCWHFTTGHGYPTPFIGRDQCLSELLPALEKQSILSRGRFGAWKYEVSNQDHSLMQGVEAVDYLLTGRAEETVANPAVVNSRKKTANLRER